MKPNQFLVAAILSAVAITGGTFVGIGSAQPCPLSSKSTSTESDGQLPQPFNSRTTSKEDQSPQPFNSTTTGAGIALLGGLLAVGGIYWYRRSRQSDSVADEADYEVPEVPSASVVEQLDSERELVGSRK